MKKKIIIAMAAMLACGQGVWAQTTSFTVIAGEEEGTEEKPFLIEDITDLNNLAADVNSGTDYEGVNFRLTTDLDYSKETLTEGSNFTTIGYGDESDGNSFKGIFDGYNHTITGITVKQDNAVGIGLFGYIAPPAVIKRLNLTGCSFTGNIEVGAIAGACSGSTDKNIYGIFDCNVSSTTVSAVTVSIYDDVEQKDVEAPGRYTGGIIGIAGNMTLSGCTSSATVTGSEFVGGIAGKFIGINDTHDITGESIGIITDCFYTGSSTFTGTNKGVIVGFRGPEEDDDVNSVTNGTINLTLYDNDSEAVKNDTRLSNYNGLEVNVTLSGRTLYKDGSWNTLCLPFGLTVSGSTLDGATVKSFSSTALNSGTLTLTFSDNASTMTAGTPYILKWASETDITNPTFSGVKISNTTANVSTDNVDFVGTYSSQVYNAVNRSVLFLGGSSKLFYPDGTAATTIGAFRAYFQLKGITAGNPTDDSEQSNSGARTFVLNFGDGDGSAGDPARIHGVEAGEDARAPQGWYTLDGRRLSGRPAAKGLYISNRRKVYVK